MAYKLLTGATGLLGSFLLKDALATGHQIAVLVRSSNFESARQRVETTLARWEQAAGRALPRPVVLEGDISQADLGLDANSLGWLSRHCDSMIHNAASLSFQADQRSGEPWRSNVEGTGNVLETCRKCGIRRFHYVSTSYVCGLRQGRILESELDEGQEFGNDYERSKVAAEKMVKEAGFLDRPTIYRPAIIVGDSQNGYTATFHGFYTPLKIVHGLINKIDPEFIYGQPLMAALGLSGSESKNFVPVDWVSAVMVYIISHPEHHGTTYHLTPQHRVPLTMWCEVVEEVIKTQIAQLAAAGRRANGDFPLDTLFRDGMDVYQSYWRDDPEFDTANTAIAAPHLPCPQIDRDTLMTLCRYAIDTNFGWPRARPVLPDIDVQQHLSYLPAANNGSTRSSTTEAGLGLQVNGPGGGQWQLAVRDDRVVAAEQGLASDGAARCYLNSKSFQRLTIGECTVKQLIQSGCVLIEGKAMEVHEVEKVLQDIVAGNARVVSKKKLNKASV
jgi:thioester reductase-like protein